MALLQIIRSSKILDLQTQINVIIPNELTKGEQLPVLWLFHGLGDNGSAWLRKTNIEQLVSTSRIAVIMPDMHRSFYCDMVFGSQYWKYLTTELISQMRELLPLSDDPQLNYLAGNSMGGYGAFKMAFNFPEQFASVIAISPVVDLSVVPSIMPEYQAVFGKNGIKDPKNDLRQMALNTDPNLLKKINWYQAIGNQDFLKNDNDDFHSFLKSKLNLQVDYHVGVGNHDWWFWNQAISDGLKWLGQKK